ncbi:MAG TPA: hypothetical protein VD913_05580 [bacterium]|nr:hypothetical protein [bacterium]
MNVRIFFLLLIGGVLVGNLTLRAEEIQQKTLNFNQRLDQAYRTLAIAGPGQGSRLFEELLADNPDEWLIYDAYTKALILRSQFDSARQVYERALTSNIPQFTPWRGDDIRHKIAALDQQKKFAEDMSKAPSWNQASVFGSQAFVVKTNIPESYYLTVAERIQSVFAREMELFEQIFGKSEKILELMKIYIFGRYGEYVDFIQKNRDEREQRLPIYYPAYYDDDQQLLVVYFNGAADWTMIAHEMAHFLLRELYVEKPSRWLDEGLAQYIAFKMEKDDSRATINGILEFLNWNYDQGVWDSLDNFFALWEKYEHEKLSNPFLPKHSVFYFLSWTFVHFFLDADAPFPAAFFKNYLSFEEESGTVTYASAQSYFRERLSAEQYEKIQDQWIRHTLNMSFDNV